MGQVTSASLKKLQTKAKQIKQDILDVAHHAGVGHIGSALSIADIIAVLYFGVLHLSLTNTRSKHRDRFILSKGHAAAALYAALYRKKIITNKQFFSYCKNGGLLSNHPDFNPKIGIEFSTGSLGHGLSVGVGVALGLNANKNNAKVYVLLSDAELNEGSTWEAIMFANHHNLNNLIAIVDDNNYQAMGKATDVLNIQPVEEKWRTFGWETYVVDGHNVRELVNAFKQANDKSKKPKVIVAKTIRGKGVSFMEDIFEWHYFPVNDEQYKKAKKELAKL